MTVTVVIASYRYGHLAAHAVESVLCQSKKADKVIFIDDGVGDCKHIKDLYPEVDFIERPVNLGIVANFQDALMRVETDKVIFLGADNWLRTDTIERLTESQADIVTYDIVVTGELKDEIIRRHGNEVTKYQGDWYWNRSSGHHGSMMYDVKKAKEVGGYAPSGGSKSEEDMVLYRRLLNAGATREHISEAFLFYRRHKSNFNKY